MAISVSQIPALPFIYCILTFHNEKLMHNSVAPCKSIRWGFNIGILIYNETPISKPCPYENKDTERICHSLEASFA